jgi:hypothetical protein
MTPSSLKCLQNFERNNRLSRDSSRFLKINTILISIITHSGAPCENILERIGL